MRAFVRLREMALTNAEIQRKLCELEGKYDSQFKVVFEAIRHLVSPTVTRRKQIGFSPLKTKAT